MDDLNEEALKVAKSHDPTMPGKFQGEPPETVYYWYLLLDGNGNTYGTYTIFDIRPDEAAYFNLDVNKYFAVMENENGFVYGKEINGNEVSKIETEYTNSLIEE